MKKPGQRQRPAGVRSGLHAGLPLCRGQCAGTRHHRLWQQCRCGVPPSEGAVIGRGVQLGAGPLPLPASVSLAQEAGAPLTVSAWIKPGSNNAAQAIYARRDGASELVLGIENRVPFVQLNGQRSTPAQPIRKAVGACCTDGREGRVAAVPQWARSCPAERCAAGAGHRAGGRRRCAGRRAAAGQLRRCPGRVAHFAGARPARCCWPTPPLRAPTRAWSATAPTSSPPGRATSPSSSRRCRSMPGWWSPSSA